MMTTERITGMRSDLSEMLGLVNPNQAPFLLNLIAMGRIGVAKSTTIAWVDYAVEGTQTSLAEAVADATTKEIKVKDASIFKAGAYILMEDEVLEVESINENVITVKERGSLDTKAAAHANGVEVYIINNGIAEGSDAGAITYKKGKDYSNRTQIFTEDIKVSGTAQSLDVPGASGIDAYDLEKTRKIELQVAKIEKSLMSGKKFSNGDVRGMDGIRSFAQQGQVFAVSNAAITMDTLNKALAMIFNAGGNLANGYYAIYVSPAQKRAMGKLIEEKVVNNTTDTTTLGAVADFVNTDFGRIPVILTPNLPATELLIVNHDACMVKYLPERNLVHTYLGTTGDNIKGQIVSECTLEVREIETCGIIKGLKR